MKPRCKQEDGFSMPELLVVLALGAVILGGMMVTYGTMMSGRGSISESVDITLPGDVALNFYGTNLAARTVPVAPNYGALARAEMLREEFHKDVIGAAGVYCLYRKASKISNPLRRNWFPFDPATDEPLETPLDFYQFLTEFDATASTVFEVPGNPGVSNSSPAPHASIYVTSFSADKTKLGILAIYEMDVIRYATARPWGFYASVRRYTFDSNQVGTLYMGLSGGYEVFYQPSVPNATSPTQFASDGFSPLFVMFERAVRRSVVEDSVLGRDRFKLAAERPFYFCWWPDPTMPNLASENISGLPREARRAYNHMGGRTAYMFTVPMFPAL